MKLNSVTGIFSFFVAIFCSLQLPGQDTKKTIPQMLCAHTWKMVKMTDVSGKGGSMGADLFAVTTKFNEDGSIHTYSSGHLTKDYWKFNPADNSLETGQLNDPKSGQIKETIVEITNEHLIIHITYRGNNVMQYDYEAVVE